MKAVVTALAFLLLIGGAFILSPRLEGRLNDKSQLFAPEWEVSEQWINSDPLRLRDLRGKVVLVDFWTYSCINCLRTIPYLNLWHQRYKDRGLVVIGIHTPEFEFEASRANVETAVERLDIRYPVAQDNDYATWKRYDNIAWPAFYLIDRNGRFVFTRYGEGEYDRIENRIRQVLGVDNSVPRDDGVDLSKVRTPEIYFGTEHEDYQTAQPTSVNAYASTDGVTYLPPDSLQLNQFALVGTWSRGRQYASLTSNTGKIVLRFTAAKVFLVAGSAATSELLVRVDDGAPRFVSIDIPRLYSLYESNDYRTHTVEIEIAGKGFRAFSFTFG